MNENVEVIHPQMIKCDEVFIVQELSILIGSFLNAKDLLSLCCCKKVLLHACSLNRLWKVHLSKDFNYNDKQSNRGENYYKRYYLGLLEDRLAEENLITGGH